MVDFIDV